MGCAASQSGGRGTHEHFDSFHDKYLIGKRLGKGKFGQVYEATRARKVQSRNGSEPSIDTARAVKIIDLRLACPSLHKLVGNEVSHWKAVSSSNHCVKFREVWYGEGLCYMIMERCKGSLLRYLEGAMESKFLASSLGYTGYDERFLGEVFLQMLLGIETLHERNIVHRDIEPGNFMVGGVNGCKIKIGDFGSSASMPSTDMLHGECGLAPFMSPEMVSGLGYDFKTDIWSFGVIVYTLLFGKYPCPQMKKFAGGRGQPSFKTSMNLSYNVIAFSMFLLQEDTNARPRVGEVLNMSYMVASRRREHAVGVDLPDLEAVRVHAKNLQAFQAGNEDAATDIDVYLNKLQMDKFDVPIHDFGNEDSRRKSIKSNGTEKSVKSTTSRGRPKTPRRKNLRCAEQVALDSLLAQTSTDSFFEDRSSTCEI